MSPRCRGQLLSCGCGSAADETDDLVAVAGDEVAYPPGLRGLRVPRDAVEPWAALARPDVGE